MPYFFRIHTDINLVYKKVWGIYDDAASREAHALWDEMTASDPAIEAYDELQDLTGVTDYRVSIALIHQLADRYASRWQGDAHRPKRMAYVVPSPEAYGTGRVYGTLMEATAIEFRACHDFAEAAEWLGLDASEIERVIEAGTDETGTQTTRSGSSDGSSDAG